MTESLTKTLYRVDDKREYRNVSLSVTTDGEVTIHNSDMGKAASSLFSASEYEFWITVSAGDSDHLIQALTKNSENPVFNEKTSKQKFLFDALIELYDGVELAADNFRDFCDQNEIKNEFNTWISRD